MRAAAFVVCAATGCSFIWARRPPVVENVRTGSGPRCSDSYDSPIVDTAVAVALAGVSVPVLAYTYCGDGNCSYGGAPHVYTIQGVALLVAAGVFAASAIYGYVTVAGCTTAVADFDRAARMTADRAAIAHAEAARVATERRKAREQAWLTTRAAAAAARAGDCATVTRLDAGVAALDREVHDTVFVRDAAIARCLAPNAGPM